MNMRNRRDDEARRAVAAAMRPERYDEALLNEMLRASRAAYRAHEARLPLRGWEFVLRQAGYIRKCWWLLQGAVLALLWLILRGGGSADYLRRCVGVLAPAFGMLALPELWKNRNCGALEVECAARFALRQVYAARLMLFGMVDLVWLSLFFTAASLGARVELEELIFQFLVPLNVTDCICFATLRARRFGSEGAALLLCGIWIAAWVLVVLDCGLYAAISTPAWCALLAVTALWMLRCAAALCKNCGENWEARPLWN